MDLVFIYGPPAAGKLTVALELSSMTGYKVLHNHLLGDVGRALFEFLSPEYVALVRKLRKVVLEEAIENDLNLIVTYVFAPRDRDSGVKEIADVVANAGGRVCYVQLHAATEILEERVVSESRLKFRKLQDVEGLRRAMARWDLFTKINESDLAIDTSELSPREAAVRIATAFGIGG